MSWEKHRAWVVSLWHLLLCRVEERYEEGEKKKEATSIGVISVHVSRNRKGPTVREAWRKNQVYLLFSFSLFKFQLYLDEHSS
jgi:hypothetical protein